MDKQGNNNLRWKNLQ